MEWHISACLAENTSIHTCKVNDIRWCKGCVNYIPSITTTVHQFSRLLFSEQLLLITILQWEVVICIIKRFHLFDAFMLCIAKGWLGVILSYYNPDPIEGAKPHMTPWQPSNIIFQKSLENICYRHPLVHSSIGLQASWPWVAVNHLVHCMSP